MDILLNLLIELVSSFLFLGLASLSVYWALLRKFQPRTAILMGALTLVVYVSGSFAVDQIASKTSIWPEIEQSFDQVWQLKSKTLADEKISQEEIDGIQASFKKYFLYCLPAWVVVVSLFTGMLSYYLVSAFGSRFTMRIDPPLAFSTWRLPEPLVFGLVIACGMKLLAGQTAWLEITANNLLVLFVALYTFAGWAVASFYLRRLRFSWLLRFIVYVALFELTFNYINLFDMPFNLVCFLGLADVWADLRKAKKPAESKK